MVSTSTARQALRAATAAHHDRVDAAFGGFALDTRAGYVAFLRAQARALLPLEAALDASEQVRALLPDWDRRRRAPLLRADLAELGETVAEARAVPLSNDTAAVLGVIYVIEGSRLGGAVLARKVPAALPQRFLDAGHSARWRSLTALLDAKLPGADERNRAISGAIFAFEAFERGACREQGRELEGLTS